MNTSVSALAEAKALSGELIKVLSIGTGELTGDSLPSGEDLGQCTVGNVAAGLHVRRCGEGGGLSDAIVSWR